MKKDLQKLRIVLGAVGLSASLSLSGCNNKTPIEVAEKIVEEKENTEENGMQEVPSSLSCVIVQDFEDCMNHTYFYRASIYKDDGTHAFDIEKSSWKEMEEYLRYDLFSDITTLQLWFNGFDKDTKEIDLTFTQIFPKLNRLFVDNLGALEINTTAVSEMTNLEDLILNNCGITDISSLNALSNLKYLELNNNEITSLDNYIIPSSLEYLNVANNHITDLSKLEEPTKPVSLNLIGNYLDEDDRTDLERLGLGSMADYILENQKAEMALIKNNH